jgi:HEAT repeat protein
MSFMPLKTIAFGRMVSSILLVLLLLFSLGCSRDETLIKKDPKTIIRDLKDLNPDVRCKAVYDLMYVYDEPVTDFLLMALRDKDWRVSGAAAYMSGFFQDNNTVEYLISLLYDDDFDSRRTAAKSLGKIKDTSATMALIRALQYEEWPTVPEYIGKALGEINDPDSVEPLIAILGNESKRNRADAATALGMIGDIRAVEPLINVLNDKSNDEKNQEVYDAGIGPNKGYSGS